MMFFIGIIFILVANFLNSYVSQLQAVKDILGGVPFVHVDVIISTIVYIPVFIVYYILSSKMGNKKIFEEIAHINTAINEFISEKKLNLPEFKTPILMQTSMLLKSFTDEYLDLEERTTKEINTLKETTESLLDIFDLEKVLVAKVNQDGKVIKANKRFLKFLAFENEVKLNMRIKDIGEIFDNKMPERWLNDLIDEEKDVSIKNIKFKLYIEKVERLPEYVITLVDVTEFDKKSSQLEYEKTYINDNLKTSFALNKSMEICMIRMLNYENYAMHLGLGILELLEEKFVEKIKSLGYDEVFKVSNDIYAVYDLKVNFNQYKKILEETIEVELGDDHYIFNPKVVLGSGVNFEQAKQQIFESSKTFLSKAKEEVKYNPEIIKLLNKSILQEKLVLGYYGIENHPNTIFIEPLVKDGYSGTIIDKEMIIAMAHEFNLYLLMIKILLLNNMSLLKDQRIIINVKTSDLLSLTILTDLLTLIKREDLDIVFNIEVDSKYSTVFPLIKTIKSYAQIGLRKVGRGFISFKDVYALKIEYLEIDETIIELINQNPQWKFLLDSVKMVVKAQNSKLITKGYSDEKVLKISSNYKMFES